MTKPLGPETSLGITGNRTQDERTLAAEVLFDRNPLPMWVYDIDSLKFTAVNDSAVEHYGYTKAEFLSMTIADIRPREDVAALLENVENVSDRLDRAGVWRHLRKDGSIISVEITSYPIDFRGRHSELVIAYDVSDRVAVEKNLHDWARLEALISEMSRTFADCDNLDAAIEEAMRKMGLFSNACRAYLFLFDESGRFMSNTHEWCSVGVDPQKEMLQNLPTDSFQWAVSQIRKGMAVSIQDVRQLPAEAANEREILELQHVKSAVMVPVNLGAKALGFLGFDNVMAATSWGPAVLRLLEIAADIIGSALQRRMDREALQFGAETLGSIMRSAEHFVFYRLAVDPDAEHSARVEFVSDSLRRIFGVEPDAPFADWFSGVHPDDLSELEEENAQSAKDGTPLDQTFRISHPAHEGWRWIRAVSNPVRDHSGVLRHFNGFLLDVTESVEASRALKAERDFANAVMDTVGALVVVVDDQGKIVQFNRACETITGYTFEEVKGHFLWDFLLPPEERQKVQEAFGELKKTQSPSDFENHWLTRDGRDVLIAWSNTAILDDQGELLFGIGTGIDITERKEAEAALRKLSSAVDQAANGVIIVDHRGKVEYVNPAYLEITNETEEAVIGRPTDFLGSPVNPSAEQSEIWARMLEGEDWRGELRHTNRSGNERWISVTVSPVHNPESNTDHFAVLIEDISELKRAHENLERLASYDILTGLPNRRLFRDRLEHALSVMRRHGTQLAVLYLDLDNFKRVNDSLGHEVGDILLREVAKRLSSCVREEDTVARLGGDEFVVLVQTSRDNFDAGNLARKLLESLKAPIMAADHEVVISSSIGITLAPSDSSDPSTLLRNADLAMYRSKSRGCDGYEFFEREMNLEAARRLSMEAELRQGLKANQLTTVFQPVFRLSDMEIVGFEALARWEHPEHGSIPPAQFIPVAEDCGLIGVLGEHLLECSLSQIRGLREIHNAELYVAVNLSARQAHDRKLPEVIAELLSRSGLPGSALRFEITESLLMKDFELARRLIEQLREKLGTYVAIDDFGTGYSSLSYLKQLPIDTLKVDRSFVKDIPADEDDKEITSAIIAMAKALKKTVVVEGLETVAQLDFLKGCGCEFGQGFLLGRPAEPGQFASTPLVITPEA